VTTFDSFPMQTASFTGRAALAQVARSTAARLQAIAERLAPRERQAASALTLPRLEFHADAGAPEGALYVDGVLFGRLPGVHRL